MGVFNWRTVYIISIAAKVFVCLQCSYIHPDEHFQSFQPIAKLVYGSSVANPWEFEPESSARSFAPLLIFYYPIIQLVKYFQLPLITAYYFVRLEFTLITWMVTDWTLWRIMPTKPERVKSLLFTSTSFVTLVYQSHAFSNSVETWLVLGAVYIMGRFREECEIAKNSRISNLAQYCLAYGCIVSAGIFNRVTFVGWLVFPGIFVLKFFQKSPISLVYTAAGFLTTSLACVVLDTWMFTGTIDWSNLVVTPLNNLLYNLDSENLSQHGIHSRLTHLLVNVPLMLGPALVFLIGSKYYKTVPFMSAISGILTLSLVPHQEFRFIIPAMPLLACCMDLSSEKKKVTKYALRLFIVYNVVMTAFFGSLHQGGIVTVMEQLTKPDNALTGSSDLQIWWRTYSPPVWLYGHQNLQVLNRIDHNLKDLNILSESDSNGLTIVDAMGSSFDVIVNLLGQRPGILISPIASAENELSDALKDRNLVLKRKWKTWLHLDMDHFDTTYGWKTFTPGLAVYEVVESS
ncbi:unnamed protein product [Kuraishia capsulata CBS 1993]|uniref:Mannosyltransferase n=1 Tax=Kuraishia capsulata CBS 1993 TaxID=1382522 RepID=W6MRF5_9ASCO|nr:uncharacterized protein KUCA_T00005319001 [Kuraishia capsulata CBS 1993]CDK29331.1 unnamed protein product [Kuraishia capsulata CBS 1993]